MPTYLLCLQHIHMLTLPLHSLRNNNPIIEPLETSINLFDLSTRKTVTLHIAIHTDIHPHRDFTQIVEAPHTLLRASEASLADTMTLGAFGVASTWP
jgi:hypothetical protein